MTYKHNDQKQIRRATMVLLALIVLIPSALAADATLTAIGDMDRLNVGQSGFCGQRKELEADSWQVIQLKGGEPVWLFASSRYRMRPRERICRIERSFTPASGQAYVLRISHVPGDCRAELFRAVPGADPVRVKMVMPEGQSCLGS